MSAIKVCCIECTVLLIFNWCIILVFLLQAPPSPVLPPAVVERLVTRVQDYPEYAEQRLQDYKKKLLQPIEVRSTLSDVTSI